MKKAYFPSLMFAVLAGFSVVGLAADGGKVEVVKPGSVRPLQEVEVAPQAQAKVNLNTADSATLQQELSGIGAVKAKAIVEYREAHGAFASVDELLEVKGIGAATLEKNRDKLSIN